MTILTSRPLEYHEPLVLLVEDSSIDPPTLSLELDNRIISIRSRDEGFTLLDFAKLLSELGITFDYQELK
jgi:hypothetical protein